MALFAEIHNAVLIEMLSFTTENMLILRNKSDEHFIVNIS
jgi:hypothetical protein